MNLIGTHTLNTPHLILRKVRGTDYKEAFKNWTNDEKVCKYVAWVPHGTEEVTKNLFKAWEEDYKNLSTFRWIVQIKETKELIGTIDVVHFSKSSETVEIGHCYGSKFWSFGYATEALKAVIKYLFEEVEVNLVEAMHCKKNPASGKVMKKAGMYYETELRNRWRLKNTNEFDDLVVYSITKDEYFSK